MLKDARHHHSSHAVTCIDHDFERFYFAHVDKREGMSHIIVGDITFCYLPFAGRCGEVATDRQIADVGQTSIKADGKGLCAAEFHAVVCAWVVRGGNHHTGGVVELAYGEIE